MLDKNYRCKLANDLNSQNCTQANFFLRYIGIIRKREGLAGLYTGLVPRVAAMGLTQKVEEEFDKYWPPLKEEDSKKEIDGDEEAIARLVV